MEEIIQINDHNGQSVVSARDLYEFLEVKRDFTTWCKKMFEYGFTEGKDFTPIWGETSKSPTGGRPSVNYALTLDTAKEISMLQRSEKGKQARQYFIECEKNLSTRTIKQSGDAIILQAVNLLQERINQQEHSLKKLTPKADFADRVIGSKSTFPVTVIAKELGMTAIALNGFLHAAGVQYKVNDCWVLYAKYQDMNYAEYKTQIYGDKTRRTLVWTEYGRAFIINKVRPLKQFEPLPFENTLINK